jgi:Xaa-Pro aminopeptidase
VADGLEAALDATRAGRTCEDVEAAWARVIRRAGPEKRSRIGYSVGLGYPPDWGERTASLRPGDTTVLLPGMCFHLIPGMWTATWGFELSETVRVTESGPPEILTRFPRELIVKP